MLDGPENDTERLGNVWMPLDVLAVLLDILGLRGIWKPLGASWGLLKRLWRRFGGDLGRIGGFWRPLGSNLGGLGDVL